MQRLILELLLGWLALYHLTVGVICFVSSRATAAFAFRAYGLTLDPGPQVTYLMKPLGAYAITIGWLLLQAFRDPCRHGLVIQALTLLLLLRAAHRTFYEEEIVRAFGVEPWRNRLNTALLVIQAAAAWFLGP